MIWEPLYTSRRQRSLVLGGHFSAQIPGQLLVQINTVGLKKMQYPRPRSVYSCHIGSLSPCNERLKEYMPKRGCGRCNAAEICS